MNALASVAVAGAARRAAAAPRSSRPNRRRRPPPAQSRRATAAGARDAVAGQRRRQRRRQARRPRRGPDEEVRHPRHGRRRRARRKDRVRQGVRRQGRRNGDGAENKVDADTVFQLASLSKPLGADGGRPPGRGERDRLGHPDRRPSCRGSRCRIRLSRRWSRVGDMYSHRSGLPDHAGDLLEDLGYDRRYVLDRLRQLPLDPFRISYAYTNFGFTAGAEAVAVSAGKSWEDLAEEVLYRPLGHGVDEFPVRRLRGPAGPRGRPHPRRRRLRAATTSATRDPEAPAGGVSSSVNDMTRWLTMVLANGSYEGKQIVDAKALLPAVTPQIVSSPATRTRDAVGLLRLRVQRRHDVGGAHAAQPLRRLRTRRGHQLRHPAVGRRGDRRAHQRHAVRRPGDADRRVRRPGPVRRGARGLVQALQQTSSKQMEEPVGSLVGKQPAAKPAPAAPLASYVGTYANDYWGPARVTEKDGKLQLALGHEAGCAAGTLGRQRVHLLLRHRKLRRLERFPRPRSTATS